MPATVILLTMNAVLNGKKMHKIRINLIKVKGGNKVPRSLPFRTLKFRRRNLVSLRFNKNSYSVTTLRSVKMKRTEMKRKCNVDYYQTVITCILKCN